jgi:hypothetical protein
MANQPYQNFGNGCVNIIGGAVILFFIVLIVGGVMSLFQ